MSVLLLTETILGIAAIDGMVALHAGDRQALSTGGNDDGEPVYFRLVPGHLYITVKASMYRMFRYLEPTFFAGLIDDPCLVVRDRPIHKSIMIDCGGLNYIAKREMKPVQAIFLSHAHMDHFMGFDSFVRQTHASPRTVHLYGPPGIADRTEARLSGYDWNLAEPYWATFVVHEVHRDKFLTVTFPGPERFKRRGQEWRDREGSCLYTHNHILVDGILLDHGIPVLAFLVRETRVFYVDAAKIQARGLQSGDWLPEMKRRFFAGWPQKPPLIVPVIHERGELTQQRFDARTLYGEVAGTGEQRSIGYLTDIGYTIDNISKISDFLSGVSLLVGECAFLSDHVHKARTSNHLSTGDWNELLQVLKPRHFLPMHLSKTYLGRGRELYAELHPPSSTTIIHLPEHLTPRPMLASEAIKLSTAPIPANYAES